MKDLKVIASMIGKQKNIPIQVGNFDTASTDGLSIFLPDSIKSPEGHALAHGYIDHEAGHVQLTDMHFFRVAAMSGRPHLKSILNILEDVRIEYAVGKQYPGSVQNLNRVVKILKKNRELEVPRVSPDSIPYIAMWLLFWARSHFLSQDLSDFAEEMERKIAPDIVSRIKGSVENLTLESDTRAVFIMALKVLDLIEENQAEPSDDSDTGDQGQSSDDSDTGDQGQSSDDSDTGDQGQSSDDSDTGDQGQSSDDSDTGDQGQSSDDSDTRDQGQSFDLGSLMAKALETHIDFDEEEINTPYLPSMKLKGIDYYGFTYLKKPLPWKKVVSSLNCLTEGDILKSRDVSRKGKRIIISKASRLAIGDTKIFKKSTMNRGQNSSFILLLDRSGSMEEGFGNTSRFGIAIEAVATLYKALEKHKNTEVRVAMFPSDDMRNFSVIEIKPEYNIRISIDGSTPLDTALEWARVELSCEPREVRKTIIVVTDGEPNCYTTAKSVAEKIKGHGINLLGIGLEYKKLDFFSAWEEINKAEDLPMALTRMAKRGLS